MATCGEYSMSVDVICTNVKTTLVHATMNIPLEAFLIKVYRYDQYRKQRGYYMCYLAFPKLANYKDRVYILSKRSCQILKMSIFHMSVKFHRQIRYVDLPARAKICPNVQYIVDVRR